MMLIIFTLLTLIASLAVCAIASLYAKPAPKVEFYPAYLNKTN